MRQKNEPCIIFSACNNESTEGDKERHEQLCHRLRRDNFLFKTLEGYYKGVKEDCVLVILENEDTLTTLKAIARCYNQESVLVLNEDRDGEIVSLKDDTTISVGKFCLAFNA